MTKIEDTNEDAIIGDQHTFLLLTVPNVCKCTRASKQLIGKEPRADQNNLDRACLTARLQDMPWPTFVGMFGCICFTFISACVTLETQSVARYAACAFVFQHKFLRCTGRDRRERVTNPTPKVGCARKYRHVCAFSDNRI